MSVLINTSDVAPKRRWQAWCHIICDTLGPLDVRRVDADAPLWGRIDAGTLGPMRLAKVTTATGHTVHRTPSLIRRDSADLYRVALALDGRHIFAQGDRQAVLAPGDFVLYDYTRPYDFAFSSTKLALFVFPQALLPLTHDQVAELTAVTIPGHQPTARLASHLLRHLAENLDAYPPATSTRLSAITLDMVTTALAEHLDQPSPLPRPAQQRLLLHRVHVHVERHLADTTLTPATIAAAHHVSLRSLQQLYADHDTTVAAFIRHRRLERCRVDLADPALASVPVSAIAARWGLPDAAHFSKLFRRTYGLPPSDYRRAFLTAAPQPDGFCAD